MFFDKKPGDDMKDDKDDKINQIKAFAAEAKQTLGKAWNAICQFEAEAKAGNSSEAANQLFNQNKHKACHKHISTMELTLEDKDKYLDEKDMVVGMLAGLQTSSHQLPEDLAGFAKVDNNAERVAHYQKAAVLAGKIDELCQTIVPPTPGRDNSR